MNVMVSGSRVSAISTAIPKNFLDVHSLKHIYGEKEVDRIVENTGIKKVRIAEAGVKTSDLCYAAATNLFNNTNIDLSEIDAIVFVSQTPDGIMPATSAVLQHRLGLSTKLVALDINYGCSGYVYGLYVASLLIASGGCKKVLMCAGDVISPLIREDDKKVRMVFGDAGSATLIEHGDDDIAFSIKTDGSGKDFLKSVNEPDQNPYITMDGAAVMNFALQEVPTIIDKLLAFRSWGRVDVGVYVMHQANEFMLNYLRKKMKIEKDKLPISVNDTGNTSSASIPLLLTQKYHGFEKNMNLSKSILCGFGVGLSCAAAALNLSDVLILDTIEV